MRELTRNFEVHVGSNESVYWFTEDPEQKDVCEKQHFAHSMHPLQEFLTKWIRIV